MRYIDEVPTVAVRVLTFANLQAPMPYQLITQKGFGKTEFDHAACQIRQTAERIERAGEKQRNAPAVGTIASILVAVGDHVDARTSHAGTHD